MSLRPYPLLRLKLTPRAALKMRVLATVGRASGGTGISVTKQNGIVTIAISDDELLALASLASAADTLPYFNGPGSAALAAFTAFARTLMDDADAATARATLGVGIGTDVQAWDADLDALAALATTGLVARIGAGAMAARTIVAPAAGITVADGGGTAGNPTLSLANDLAGLERLSGTGLATRTATDAWANRTITGSAGLVTVANGDGVAGNPTITIPDQAITYAKLQNASATSRLLGRKTAGAGSYEELTLSDVLDLIGGAAQGDILYRGASGWARLGAGTSGQFLKTQGAAANPAWANVPGGGDMLSSNNLSDVANAAAARTNLGATTVGNALFTAATSAAGRTTLGIASPQCFVYRNASQSVTSAALTKMQFDTRIDDPNSWFDISTNFRFQPNIAGGYLIEVRAAANITTNDAAVIVIYLNGNPTWWGTQSAFAASGTPLSRVMAQAYTRLNGSTDYIEAYIYVPSGITTYTAGVASNSFFTMKVSD